MTHDIYNEDSMTDPNLTPPSEDYRNLEHEQVTHVFDTLASEINHIARDKGFWTEALTDNQVVDEWFYAIAPALANAKTPAEIKKHVYMLVRRARKTMERNEAEMLMLEVSELSEALEGIRHGNPPSDKIPEFSVAEEELADTLIRIFDHALGKGYRLADAVLAKIEYNRTRAFKHGKTC